MAQGRSTDETCGNCGLTWSEKRVKDDEPMVGYAYMCPRCGAVSEGGAKKMTELARERTVDQLR